MRYYLQTFEHNVSVICSNPPLQGWVLDSHFFIVPAVSIVKSRAKSIPGSFDLQFVPSVVGSTAGH